jgi:hypothetical protein
MARILCLFGWHDYKQFLVAEIPPRIVDAEAVTFHCYGRRFYDEVCKRCGHTVKAF